MIMGVVQLFVIPTDTESIVQMLVDTDADWTGVLRFLGTTADGQGIQMDTQKIAELVRQRISDL